MLNIGSWIGRDDSRDSRLQLRLFSPHYPINHKRTCTPLWCVPHPELVGPQLIDVGPLARHRLVPKAELQQELISAWHQHLAALIPVSHEFLPVDTRQSNTLNLNWRLQVAGPGSERCESLPCFVWACSSPLSELDIHPCNATDGLGI